MRLAQRAKRTTNKLGQSGYADTIVMVVALSVLVIIATIVAIANLNAHNPFIISPTPTPSATQSPPISPSPSPTASASASPAISAGDAFSTVKAFYAAYAQDPSGASQYLSTAVASQVAQDGNQAVYCSQTQPASLSYDPPVGNTGTASVSVHEDFNGANPVVLQVTVDLTSALITNISCP